MAAIIFAILGTIASLITIEYFELNQTWGYVMGLYVGMIYADINSYSKRKKL